MEIGDKEIRNDKTLVMEEAINTFFTKKIKSILVHILPGILFSTFFVYAAYIRSGGGVVFLYFSFLVIVFVLSIWYYHIILFSKKANNTVNEIIVKEKSLVLKTYTVTYFWNIRLKSNIVEISYETFKYISKDYYFKLKEIDINKAIYIKDKENEFYIIRNGFDLREIPPLKHLYVQA